MLWLLTSKWGQHSKQGARGSRGGRQGVQGPGLTQSRLPLFVLDMDMAPHEGHRQGGLHSLTVESATYGSPAMACFSWLSKSDKVGFYQKQTSYLWICMEGMMTQGSSSGLATRLQIDICTKAIGV